MPKTFQCPLAKEKSLMLVKCDGCVEMMARNVVAPFKFVRRSTSIIFSVKFGNVEDHLAQICQLQRASTLPPVDQNGMIAAIVFSRQNRLSFDSCLLESVHEKVLLKV